MLSSYGFDDLYAAIYAANELGIKTIDFQHGMNDYPTSLPMLQAISNTPTIPFARVPWNEPGIIMKLLDAGTCGIIAPMINVKKKIDIYRVK